MDLKLEIIFTILKKNKSVSRFRLQMKTLSVVVQWVNLLRINHRIIIKFILCLGSLLRIFILLDILIVFIILTISSIL